MGRSRGQQNDRLYIKRAEYDAEWGGKQLKIEQVEKPIGFDCCALSLQPFVDPVCTPDGTIYDIVNIIKWFKKYKVDPRTGEKMSPKDMITLHFHKSREGRYHCPVTCTEFTNGMRIVAIGTTGNVYSWEAVLKLNIEPKIWTDLLTDEPFTKADILYLHDPNDLDKRRVSQFYYFRNRIELSDQDHDDPTRNVNMDSTMREVMEKLKQKPTSDKDNSALSRRINTDTRTGQHVSTKKLEVQPTYIQSLTATHVVHRIEPEFKCPEVRTRKKGRAQIVTNFGLLDIALHCDLCPKTCENFLGLCERGYYDGLQFHRSIKNFMIQGGCPENTGRGGQSIWGEPFEDEIVSKLKHDGRGVLAMANHGPNTNGSQFYILYKSAKHLDGKHTIFGRISPSSMSTLKNMEAVETVDNKPIEPISIMKAAVLDNPLAPDAILQEQEEEEAKKLLLEREQKENKERGLWFSNPSGQNSGETSIVGKYIKANIEEKTTTSTGTSKGKRVPLDFTSLPQTKKKTIRTNWDLF